MKSKKLKIIGLIQAHYLSWNGAPDFSLSMVDGKYAIEHVIARLKSIPKIERIVIAVPKDPKNIVFSKIAQTHNISCYFGSQSNVLLRSKRAIDLVQGDIVIHVMGQHCFIDTVLLENMTNSLLSTKSDYISLPDDFTPYFAGKIYNRNFLNKVEVEIKKLSITQRKIFNARFFSFIESNRKKFNVTIFSHLPIYTRAYLEKVRKTARNIFVDDRLKVFPKKVNSISNPLYESYKFAMKQITSFDTVLDLGCGDGFGCRIISPHASKVIGLDINKKLIQVNNKKNKHKNILYVNGNVCSLTYSNKSFDVVTGIEIIEHILPKNVNAFISEVKRVLKPNGVFICSTPQNSTGSIPVVPWHKKEYSLTEFKAILGSAFLNIKIYGSKSGGPLTEDEYGQKMVAVCRFN